MFHANEYSIAQSSLTVKGEDSAAGYSGLTIGVISVKMIAEGYAKYS